MSVKSVLKGCHEVLTSSAVALRTERCAYSAYQCDIQAEAVLRLLADLDNEQQEEPK